MLDPVVQMCEDIVKVAGAFHRLEKYRPIDVAIVAAVHGFGKCSVEDLVRVLPWNKTEIYERLLFLRQDRLVTGKIVLSSDIRAGDFLTKIYVKCNKSK